MCGTFLGSGNAAINYWSSIERPSPWPTRRVAVTYGCGTKHGPEWSQKRNRSVLRMGCCLWTVSILPHPLLSKKNLASHSYILPKENTLFCTWNSEHDYSTANTDSAVYISYLSPKISVLVLAQLYVHLTVTKSLKAKSRTHFSSCSTHERNVKGQIKHGHDLYASAVYLTTHTQICWLC